MSFHGLDFDEIYSAEIEKVEELDKIMHDLEVEMYEKEHAYEVEYEEEFKDYYETESHYGFD